MAELPRTIAGWSAPLSILKTELGDALGAWMPALAGLVGPMRKRDRSGRVTVDGVSGLSRRGSYERLLVSEWAIAQAAPLEFLRRAAGSEHLFTDLERREPAGSRRSVILVDVGPDQLGAPRIVHLAALIVLGRRAALAGAAVTWGTLQRSPHPPWDAVDEASLKRMLRQRSAAAPSQIDLDRWLDLTGFPQAGDELWLLGSAALQRRAPAGAHLLLIEDAAHPDGAVRVTAARAGTGGGRRTLSLPLPPSRLQPVLLQSPFRSQQVPAPQHDAPAGIMRGLKPGFRFSHSGTRLLGVEPRTGALISIRLPHKNRAPLRVDRLPVSSQHRVVGLGYHQGPYALLRDTETKALLLRSKRSQPETLPIDAAIATALAAEAPTTVLQLRSHRQRRTRFLCGDRLLDLDHSTGELSVVAGGCLAAWLTDGHPCVLGDDGRGLALTRHSTAGSLDTRVALSAPGRAAFVGYRRNTALGLVVINTEGALWQAVGQPRAETLKAPRRAVVYGCMSIGLRSDTPALLVCTKDGLTLALIRTDTSHVMPTDHGRVVYATASTARPQIAWMTEDGTLTVWDVAKETRVAQITAEAPS